MRLSKVRSGTTRATLTAGAKTALPLASPLLPSEEMRLARNASAARAFALMEPMVAMGLLAIVASSTIYAMISSNRFAIQQRYVSNAKALCQERIDEALASAFPPVANNTFFGNWSSFTAGTEVKTLQEDDLPIYESATSGSTSPAPPALVRGTRTTWVTRFPNPATADPAFVYARVRVRVEFWLSGRGLNNKLQSQAGALPFSYEMTTLRAAD